MLSEQREIPEDVMLMAWVITAEHLTKGEKDVTKIVADAIWKERKRHICSQCPPAETQPNYS
ncbi:hypothetical protein [Agrobacterium tumefaciens]|uniref:hypothetical protein n=1 Tax=Agrobacterium tumefaciens TaxID=358 RepID=UPI001573B2AC|nr:hypothetical protein [Agrobacterium tumefaciens]NSY51295.1 hypothetical protein [Agrobacterium tumefaciens]NTD86715.1 hypothetical protein [Agrobacterium tumefaciens]NTD93960.1 hypothetical protein [Agrobacterium tumefaciens]NTE03935.1 hypothetical protein [Agrobacterium tumefaciens]NTE11400.1 hypothetical protein [Agrobacterium tumefaciens]